MDIYDYLKLDHEHVAQLFKQFEKAQLLTRRKQIVLLIAQELLIHAHGLKEHQEIEDQISLILHSKEFGDSWVKKVEKLKEVVEHHVKDEEGTMFKEAQKVLSKEEAYDLKEKMHYLKQYLLLSLQKESRTVSHNKNKTIKKSSPKKTSTIKNPAHKRNGSGSSHIH